MDPLGFHERVVEGQNPFPQPALAAAKDKGFLIWELMYWVSHPPTILSPFFLGLLRAALNPASSQPVICVWDCLDSRAWLCTSPSKFFHKPFRHTIAPDNALCNFTERMLGRMTHRCTGADMSTCLWTCESMSFISLNKQVRKKIETTLISCLLLAHCLLHMHGQIFFFVSFLLWDASVQQPMKKNICKKKSWF